MTGKLDQLILARLNAIRSPSKNTIYTQAVEAEQMQINSSGSSLGDNSLNDSNLGQLNLSDPVPCSNHSNDKNIVDKVSGGNWSGGYKLPPPPPRQQGSGPDQRKDPIRCGSLTELWNKVMKEVKAKRYEGPFEDIPYESYIQSPIGLVEKDHGNDTRLIFHLSHPRNASLNFFTPKEKCSMQYKNLDEAIKLCMQAGKVRAVTWPNWT